MSTRVNDETRVHQNLEKDKNMWFSSTFEVEKVGPAILITLVASETYLKISNCKHGLETRDGGKRRPFHSILP